ncbi:S8 family serine peptidase [Jidongwangia harbinensis]|uniref:S8 family serine peptidase n=1 Tax=Jidongwangia harbinensis TaxID=2878561 RepID=UPI001CD929F9|nr:S8 family serine peptidase [Jidongwangia harbinensis]MCA2218727.1 S8 family serine peptidase [Jidongwangia harbinensis]
MRRTVTAAILAGALAATGSAVGPAPAMAATTDWTFPATAATLADVARSIRADAAYAAGYTGKGVGIALIDTGVVPVSGLTSGNIANGPDLSLESQVPSLLRYDGYGHGTHLAGIIAGRDSATTATGFRGIAPDAKLISLKVGMSNGAVDVTQVMAAIDWVVEHRNDDPKNPIRIINLSYGTDGTQSAESDPLGYAVSNAVAAGINVVVAAGNTGSRITNPATGVRPIVVGSTDPRGTTNPADDVISAFSAADGRGIAVDVLAPGRSVVSLRNPGSFADTFYPSARVGDRYFKGSGTSQAAAVVSGALALYLQKYPNATTEQARLATWGNNPQYANTQWKLNVATMLQPPPNVTLTTARGTGTGSIQKARGTTQVTFGDATALTGERDIFGPLSAPAWAFASTTQTAWNGGSWMGRVYTGTGWGPATNGQANWAGRAWSGRAWSGRAWSDVAWAGRAWSGRAWSGTGSEFTGRAWSGGSWSGARWE